MNPYVRAFEIVRYCYASPDAFAHFAHAVEDAIGPVLLDCGFVEAALDVAVDGGEQIFDAVRGYFRDAGHQEAVEQLAHRIFDEWPPS